MEKRITTLKSYRLYGEKALPVTISVTISEGIGIHVVGIPDQQVREVLLRAITALQSCGYRIPGKKTIINFSPVDHLKGDCSKYDLPVALGLLAASGQESFALPEDGGAIIAGELGLDGSVRSVRGSLQGFLLSQSDRASAILPFDNAMDAYAVTSDSLLYGVHSLPEAVSVLRGDDGSAAYRVSNLLEQDRTSRDALPEVAVPPPFDLPRLRTAAIAAAGGFGLYCQGEPGTAPHTMASLVRSLLSAPGRCEGRDQTLSLLGRPYGNTFTDVPLVEVCPDSRPRTLVGEAGSPGEVTAAHTGVLHVREAEKISKTTSTLLEAAYQDGEVHIHRLWGDFTYPSDILPVLTAVTERPATAPSVPGTLAPLWMQMHPLAPSAKARRFLREEHAKTCDAVRLARQRALRRTLCPNARLTPEQCGDILTGRLDSASVVKKISEAFGWDGDKRLTLVRIARTIADLDGTEEVTPGAVAEAAGYLNPHAA